MTGASTLRRRRQPGVASVLVIGLLVAACGGTGTDEDAPGQPSAAAPAVDDATESTARPTTAATPTSIPTIPASEETSMSGGAAGDANVDEIERLVAGSGDEDGPFYMVNLIRYRAQAEYPDGRATDLTGEEADAIYGEYMVTTKLPEIGAEIVYVGDVEGDLTGSSQFDHVAVVRYPSRSAFIAMSQDPGFREMVIHKHAGVLDTVVLATTRLDTPQAPPAEDPPFPATAGDPPFAFVHVLDYRDTAEYAEGDEDADPDRSGEEAVALYSANAGAVAAPLGVRPAAWFAVQATIIGPVDTWDEVRINTFPSHAAFDELISDATWQAGQHHRAAGLTATYALMTLPRINELNGVVAAS